MKRTLTPEFKADGKSRLYADGGAVKQQGDKAVSRCSCGKSVVWLKSTKSGKFYLANVFGYHTHQDAAAYNTKVYYMGHSIHKCEGVVS